MKINKVTLTDYRSFEGEHTFKFSDGINLLLGKNGAGKSSILEAVGVALFGTGNRNSNTKDSITFNKISSTISVEFEGNDGIDYRVDKKIGSGAYCRLYRIGELSPRADNIKSVEAKVSELAGIEKNTENIYRDVITAYQNKITGIFLDTASERSATFNRIFDTQIYKMIYSGYAKDVLDNYEQVIENRTGSYETLNNMLKNDEELTIALMEAKIEKANASEKLICITEELKSLDKSEKELTEINNKIKNINQELDNLNAQSDINKKNVSDAEKLLADSVEAKKIIDDNQDNFDNYNKISVEQKALRNELNELERADEHKNKLILSKKELEKKSEIAQNEIIGFKKNIEEKNGNIVQLKNDLNELQIKLEKEKETTKTLFDNTSVIVNIKSTFDDINSNFITFSDKQKKLEQSISEAEASLPDFEKLVRDAESQKMIISGLRARKDEMHSIEAEINKIKARINENEEANSALSDGVCPFLKEGCKNISTGSNAAGYFANKRAELSSELEKYNLKLKEYYTLNEDITNAENQLALTTKTEKDGEKAKELIANKKTDLQICIKDIEICRKNIVICLSDYAGELPGLAESADFKLAENFLIEIITKTKAEYKQSNDNYLRTEDECKKLNSTISETENTVKELEETISLKAKEREESENEIIKVTDKITELDAVLLSLPDKKSRIADIEAKLTELKPAYEKYMSNKKASEEIDNHRNKIKSINESISALEKRYAGLSIELSELSSKFCAEEFEKVITAKKEKSGQKEQLISELSLSSSRLEAAQKAIEDNKKISVEIDLIKSQINHTTRKIELIKKLRDNLNEMGKLVAGRLLSKIELLASDNYRRISGRTEQIRWFNDANNSYLVCIDDGRNNKKFEQLSGGEQVTVAIAIRSAMASVLTKANFAIFDEPTNNLDTERRAALSESLQDMFGNLRQAIIVTHDDTFREMANRIISVTR